MKAYKAIKELDRILENDYSYGYKYNILQRLEKRYDTEVYKTHEAYPGTPEITEAPVFTVFPVESDTPGESLVRYETEAADESVIKYIGSSFIHQCKKITLSGLDAENKTFVLPGWVTVENGDKLYPDVNLSIPVEYEELYVYYLEAQIYFRYHEIDRYNDAAAMYMELEGSFRREYNRSHMPKHGEVHLL